MALYVVLIGLLLGLPLLAAELARRQAVALELDVAQGYAAAVLARSDRMSVEIEAGLAMLRPHGAQPCSAAAIEAMRDAAISLRDFVVVGHQADDLLKCSSMGPEQGPGMPLAPVAFTGTYQLRRNIVLPHAPTTQLNGIERDGWVFITPALQSIDVPVPADTSLATYSLAAMQIRASIGTIAPEWVRDLGVGGEASFVDGDNVVAVITSERFPSGAIAAFPTRAMATGQHQFGLAAFWLAAILALSLSAWVMLLARRWRTISSFSIRRGLRHKEFFLVYQPIVELEGGRWVGAEALMRWQRGSVEIPPDRFIGAAERLGVIGELTRTLFETVGREAPGIFAANADFYLSLNLAASDLAAPETRSRIQRLLQRMRAAPARIRIEVTERNAIDDRLAGGVIAQLREAGIAVMLDDFGTGVSNLNYLTEFRFDYIKVDKRFIQGMQGNPAAQDVALHIFALARSLSIDVVAEGVEQELQAQLLRMQGVRYAQGWLYARPMPALELAARLSEP